MVEEVKLASLSMKEDSKKAKRNEYTSSTMALGKSIVYFSAIFN
jgi:hypothetical protein